MDFTKQAGEALKIAKKTAKELKHPYVGTEHLLIGLRRVYRGVAGQVLANCQVEEEQILKVMEELVSPTAPVALAGSPQLSPRLEFILEESAEEAARARCEKIGTEHILLMLIRDVDCVAARILLTLNMDLQKMMQEILEVSGTDIREYQEEMQQGRHGRRPGILEQYGTDLTREAQDGRLDPVIGREKETERLMLILSRRTKNNPCLVGEPGVGKTAVVEGLAQRIAVGAVPEHMKEKRIFTIDLPGMVAGTKYRGEFEERMKGLIREVKASRDVVLFLDEVHTMIGAGGAEGSMDASNILKPSLSRGEMQLIGATTVTEYRKYIEKDAALERRFQPIEVEEPSREECLEILRGLKEKHEAHHHVEVQEDALRAAVFLSERYISDRFLPDKALDVLDEACAKAGMKGLEAPPAVFELEKLLGKLKEELEEAIRNQDMAQAAMIHREQEETEKKLSQAQARFERRSRGERAMVTEDEVAQVVAQWSKVPVQRLKESESARLNKLEKALHKRVIGQEEAVTAIARAVRRGRVGLKDPKRPTGSFLFLGPTGVGKTELSKALSEALFGNEEAMIRVDMSEYMEKHSVAKMIGSPPGYIGHDDGGQLSEQIRRHPYSVVLFDEIEKAHPDVFNILLQVLDDGHITDSQGRKVDFRNTVIIMTSNAGAKSIIDPKRLGFNTKEDAAGDYERMKSKVMGEVKLIFRPEFLNRIDEILVFHPLQKAEMKRIASLLCKEVVKRAKEQLNIRLVIRDPVKNYIVEAGTDQKYGARPLRRAVQNLLEDKLAEEVLSGKVQRDSEVVVSLSKKQIKFTMKA